MDRNMVAANVSCCKNYLQSIMTIKESRADLFRLMARELSILKYNPETDLEILKERLTLIQIAGICSAMLEAHH